MRHLKFLCLLIVFSICLSSTGCQLIEQIQGDEKSPQKNTFIEGAVLCDSAAGDESPPFVMAMYRHNNMVDIFNAEFTLSFGVFGNEITLQNKKKYYDYPEFDIYLLIQPSENKEDWIEYHYRHIEENLISEKYCYSYNIEAQKYEYRYSETIKIPTELFKSPIARISIYLKGVNTRELETEAKYISGAKVDFNYIRNGDKIYVPLYYDANFLKKYGV